MSASVVRIIEVIEALFCRTLREYRGNLLAATSRTAPFAYSFFYRAALFRLPDLTKICAELALPTRLKSISVTGH